MPGAHLFPVRGGHAKHCLLEVCGAAFARVKGWVNLIKKLKLASVCFPEKKKKKKNTVKLFVFLQGPFSDFRFWCVSCQETDGSDQ